METTYKTLANDTFISMDHHAPILKDNTRKSFPNSSDKILKTANLFQKHLNEITTQKTDFESQLSSKICINPDRALFGVQFFILAIGSIIAFGSLLIGRWEASGYGVGIVLSSLPTTLLIGEFRKCGPGKRFIKRNEEITGQLEVAKKRQNECIEMCHLTNQLAALQEKLHAFTAKPNEVAIKGLFDELADLVSQVQKHIGQTFPIAVYNLALMAEICKAFQSGPLVESWQAILDTSPKEHLWTTRDDLPWKDLHMANPSNENYLKYFELCEQGEVTAVKLIHAHIDSFLDKLENDPSINGQIV